MLPLLLFVFSFFVRYCQSLETDVTYDLRYYAQSEPCYGAPPPVELSARDKRSWSSGYGDWFMLRYHTGNCSSSSVGKISSGRLLLEEGSELQLRLVLSSGPTCYCISLSDNFTFSAGLSVSASTLFCGASSPCGTGGNATTQLSRVITVTDGVLVPSTDCTNNGEAVSGANNGAAIFAESFGGTCPESEETCFALQPLDNSSRVNITHKIAVNFVGQCRPVNLINEGVLLAAQIDNAKVFPIGFYYSRNTLPDSSETLERYPQLLNEEGSALTSLQLLGKDDDTLTLLYSNGTIVEVIGTRQTESPNAFVMNIFETDQLLYTNVTFNFSQMFISRDADCDNWALDHVYVAVEHGDCSRVMVETDFDSSPTEDGWDIYQAEISQGIDNCTNANSSCLYFTGWEGSRQLASRYAATPTLDLRVLAAIYPPKWSTFDTTPCIPEEKVVRLSFLLQTIQFRQPSPCTDSTPNGIDLSIDVNKTGSWKLLVYFAPVANAHWLGLNITEMTLLMDSTHIPIQAPTSGSEKMEVKLCVPNDTSSLLFRWRQAKFGPEKTDQWLLDDVDIRVEEDGIVLEVVDSPLWTLTNGMSYDSGECLSKKSSTAKLFAGSNDNLPRQAVLNVTLITAVQSSTTSTPSPTPLISSSVTPGISSTGSSPSSSNSIPSPSPSVTATISSTVSSSSSFVPTPSPSPSFCLAEGDRWPETPVGTSRNGSCEEGSLEVTRHCLNNGTWETLDCQTLLFASLLDQIMSSPETGLQLLQQKLTSSKGILMLEQATLLLNAVYLSVFPNTTSPEFSQEFFSVASQLLNDQQDFGDTSDEEVQREVGSLLLMTLDDFALNSISSGTVSISTDNIELHVQKVLQPVEPVVGIQVEENNRIVLPVEIFTTDKPVRVASLFFRNLSFLLLPNEPNARVASPVISSTTDCSECRTQQLDTNVTITLTLPQENVPRDPVLYNDSLSCVYWEFVEAGEGDLPTGRWSRSGCSMTSREGPVVMCECNHLTHFAILLSPGVELPQEHTQVLTILGYILIPFSLLGLLLTMLTYIIFRSLWNMRSYIHIMLCGSMFVAQLTFVIGVDKTDNEDLCAAISVLLLYLFLVMFMWKLMEGVVLYIALVKVFVKHTKRYIAAFTVFSFGIPMLYMAVIVPVGFTVDDGNNFLYVDSNGTVQACWLNPSNNFVWAFISPVLVIILTNVGFLIMSSTIMYRHQKRQKDKSKIAKARHWIKVIISLMLLMGIGWALNLVFFVEELFFVAYLSAIFIAGQGIGIFLLFVVFSKKVRQAVMKSLRVKTAGSDFWSKIFPSTKSTYKTNSSKSHNGKTSPNNFHLNGMGTFGEPSVTLKEPLDLVNSKTLLQDEEEGKNVHANIYVLSPLDTADYTSGNKVDLSASHTHSEPDNSYEEQTEFMHF